MQRASQFGLDDVFGNPIDEKLWRATNPLGIAEELDPKKLDGLHLYFDAGTDDRFGFGKSNEQLHQTLDKKGVPHSWELVQGGGHAWGSGFKEESLLASLKFVGNAFTPATSDGRKAGGEGAGGAKDAGAKADTPPAKH